MAIFIKDGKLTVGTCLENAQPVLVPRDSNLSPPALVWGIDRSNDCFYPVSVNCCGQLDTTAVLCGCVSVDAVKIEDRTSGQELDIISAEGATISTDNINGVLTYGAYDDAGTLKTAIPRLTSDGVVLTTPSTTILSEAGSGAIQCASCGSTACACMTSCTSWTVPKQFNVIGVHFDNACSRNVCIYLNDGTTDYLIQGLSACGATDLVITEPIRVSCAMGVVICIQNLAEATTNVNYRFEAEQI